MSSLQKLLKIHALSWKRLNERRLFSPLRSAKITSILQRSAMPTVPIVQRSDSDLISRSPQQKLTLGGVKGRNIGCFLLRSPQTSPARKRFYGPAGGRHGLPQVARPSGCFTFRSNPSQAIAAVPEFAQTEGTAIAARFLPHGSRDFTLTRGSVWRSFIIFPMWPMRLSVSSRVSGISRWNAAPHIPKVLRDVLR